MKHLDLDFNLFCRSITVKDMSHNFLVFLFCFQYTIFVFLIPPPPKYSPSPYCYVAKRRKEQMMSLHEGDKSVMFFLPKLLYRMENCMTTWTLLCLEFFFSFFLHTRYFILHPVLSEMLDLSK